MNSPSSKTSPWRERLSFGYRSRRSLRHANHAPNHSYRQAFMPHNRRGLRRQIVMGGFAWLLAIGLGLTASARAATINFFDGVFNNADWSATKIVDTTTGSAASFTAFQQPTLGNPTFHRETTHVFGAGAIRVGHLRNVGGSPFTYDPSSSGAINTLDVAYDLVHRTPTLGAVGYALLLRQGGKYYTHPLDNIFPNVWSGYSHTGFTSASFFELLTPGAGINLSSNPNFSATGSLIEFGYVTSNSHSTQGVIVTKTSGIDNFGLTLNTVPEPASLISIVFGATAIGGFAAWRKRRMRQRTPVAKALFGTE
jgi:hypothetical protein